MSGWLFCGGDTEIRASQERKWSSDWQFWSQQDTQFLRPDTRKNSMAGDKKTSKKSLKPNPIPMKEKASVVSTNPPSPLRKPSLPVQEQKPVYIQRATPIFEQKSQILPRLISVPQAPRVFHRPVQAQPPRQSGYGIPPKHERVAPPRQVNINFINRQPSNPETFLTTPTLVPAPIRSLKRVNTTPAKLELQDLSALLMSSAMQEIFMAKSLDYMQSPQLKQTQTLQQMKCTSVQSVADPEQEQDQFSIVLSLNGEIHAREDHYEEYTIEQSVLKDLDTAPSTPESIGSRNLHF